MKKQIIITLFLLIAGVAQLSAQGIIVYKTDGTFDIYPAEQVARIVTYRYGEEPQPGEGTQPDEEGTQTFTVNGVSFKMVSVEGGSFWMGNANDYRAVIATYPPKPRHYVTISSFSIGQTEVTQALWYAVMGQKPTADGAQWSSTSTGYGLGDNYPAYYVSWEDCQVFLSRLNELTGKQFRLPTESEWEFAARGGTKSNNYIFAGSDEVGDVAWYMLNAYTAPREVATKKPNELGIYDMSGNVSEWCQDWYGSYTSDAQTDPTGPASGTNRIVRGGSYADWNECAVFIRSVDKPSSRSAKTGLRLVLSVEATE